MNWSSLERREFLRRLGLTGAGALLATPLGRTLAAAGEVAAATGQIPTRKFGRHDLQVPCLAMGGHALRVASDEEAARMFDYLLEVGMTFLDNSWDYHKGAAEELQGKLMAGRRDKFFLMTKVCTHDDAGNYDKAMAMLDESLRRLGTDHLDLWQWHAVSTMDQVKKGFADRGVVQALTDAKKSGKVRFVGFTGHTDPEVHLAILKEKYPFDACLLPVAAIEANSDAFTRRVLPEVVRQGIAALGMKALGGNGKSVRDGIIGAPEAIRYSLSQPIASLVTGPTSLAQLKENVAVALNFQPMPPDQLAALEDRVKAHAGSKDYEPYRRWMSYRDGDAAVRALV